MKSISAIACSLYLTACLYGNGGEISDLLPDMALDSVRFVAVGSDDEAPLTVSVSYNKNGYFEGSDQYDILLLPKEQKFPWGTGFAKSRINRDGEGYRGVASLRNMNQAGFKIHFNITWITNDSTGEFTPILDAKWVPVQDFEVDGVSITVTVSKKN